MSDLVAMTDSTSATQDAALLRDRMQAEGYLFFKQLVDAAGLRHGYLEDQLFAPAVTPRSAWRARSNSSSVIRACCFLSISARRARSSSASSSVGLIQ